MGYNEGVGKGKRGVLEPDYNPNAQVLEQGLHMEKNIRVSAPDPRSLQGDNPELAKQLSNALGIPERTLKRVLRRNKYILIFDVSDP